MIGCQRLRPAKRASDDARSVYRVPLERVAAVAAISEFFSGLWADGLSGMSERRHQIASAIASGRALA
jgi:hypothetical protein